MITNLWIPYSSIVGWITDERTNSEMILYALRQEAEKIATDIDKWYDKIDDVEIRGK